MAAERWTIDPSHSSVNFWVRHLMVSKVHGTFTRWSGWAELDEQDPRNSRLEVEIQADSIDTREPQRDAHLRSADFFEVEAHPAITFRSTGFEPAGEGEYAVLGDLTIRGVTQPVALAVEYAGRVKDPWGNERVGFSVKTVVHRKDFGLTWNAALEAGGVVVGDKVEITGEVEAIKA